MMAAVLLNKRENLGVGYADCKFESKTEKSLLPERFRCVKKHNLVERPLARFLVSPTGSGLGPTRGEMQGIGFSLLPAAGDYSKRKLFVFRRR